MKEWGLRCHKPYALQALIYEIKLKGLVYANQETHLVSNKNE